MPSAAALAAELAAELAAAEPRKPLCGSKAGFAKATAQWGGGFKETAVLRKAQWQVKAWLERAMAFPPPVGVPVVKARARGAGEHSQEVRAGQVVHPPLRILSSS